MHIITWFDIHSICESPCWVSCFWNPWLWSVVTVWSGQGRGTVVSQDHGETWKQNSVCYCLPGTQINISAASAKWVGTVQQKRRKRRNVPCVYISFVFYQHSYQQMHMCRHRESLRKLQNKGKFLLKKKDKYFLHYFRGSQGGPVPQGSFPGWSGYSPKLKAKEKRKEKEKGALARWSTSSKLTMNTMNIYGPN